VQGGDADRVVPVGEHYNNRQPSELAALRENVRGRDYRIEERRSAPARQSRHMLGSEPVAAITVTDKVYFPAAEYQDR
jgi:hypothetical protein